MPKQRDKADNSRNAYLTRCYHQCKYPPINAKRQIQQMTPLWAAFLNWV